MKLLVDTPIVGIQERDYLACQPPRVYLSHTHQCEEDGEDGVAIRTHTPRDHGSGDGTYVPGPCPCKRQIARGMILGMKSIALVGGHLLQAADARAQILPMLVVEYCNGFHALVKMGGIVPFHQEFRGLPIADLQAVLRGCSCTHGADHAMADAQTVENLAENGRAGDSPCQS